MKKLFMMLFAMCLIIGITPIADAAYISEIESNDSFATAQNLNGAFSLDSDSDIFWSDTYWHASVNAVYGAGYPNDVDYFNFTVGQAGITGFFDIDYGEYDSNSRDVDTVMALFDSSHNVMAVSDDSIALDPGTVDTYDSFIGVYTFANPGTYYLAVSDYWNLPGNGNDDNWGTYAGYMTRPDNVFLDAGDWSWINDFSKGDSGPQEMYTLSGSSSYIGDYVLHASLSERPTQVVPEPATMMLFGSGLFGLLGFRKKFRKS